VILISSPPVATIAPKGGLLGKTKEEAALIDQWMHVMETEVDVHTTSINGLVLGRLSPYSKPVRTSHLPPR
jgi:elongation factor 1-gamma